MPALQDLQYAVRGLRKTPGFTAAAVLVLGLGIGANLSIFSLIDALLIRPMPLDQPERLVNVWEDDSRLGFPRDTPAPANFADWKQRNHVFTDMAALQGQIFAITGEGEPQQVESNPITANLLPLLGISPILGRNFLPEEDRPGAARVALISHRLWQQRYGGDPAIVGRGIMLDGVGYRITGVMPRGFAFPDRSDIWVPIAFTPARLAGRSTHYLQVFARLKAGVPVDAAQREMAGIAAQLSREYPESNTGVGAVVVSLRDQLLGNRRPALWVLAGGVGCVLLIACANLAGLLLARASGRQREMAVRAALGAGRLNLLRQGFIESLAIAAAGSAAALLFALWTIPFLSRMLPPVLAEWTPPHIDLRLIAFTAAVGILATLLSGTLPAISMLRVDLAGVLRQGGHGSIGGRSRVRGGLVVAEVAMAVILSVAAGLMMQTVWSLEHGDLGFHPEGVLTARTSLPFSVASRYTAFPARSVFYTSVLDRVKAIPGVVSAGYTTFLPLTNRGGTSGFLVEGAPPLPPGQYNDANHRVISAEYLRTIGVRLLAGRFFDAADGPDRAPVAIVNRAMARQFWPNLDPLGRHFRFPQEGAPWFTIVGVVDDVRQMGLDVAGRAEMYFPSTQAPASVGYFAPRDLAIRVHGDPMQYAEAVRQAVWAVDRNQPVADVRPFEALVEDEAVSQRALFWLLGGFAALALVLSALGLYALLSYTVAQHTREIGVRMALGARRTQVLGQIMRQGMRLVIGGVFAGLASAAFLARLLMRLLYGVKPDDPLTFAAVAVTLLLAGCVACLVPSLRAARMEPMTSLRYE